MKALIIGSGIGGMASAIRLAAMGLETHVFEQNAFYGGKINSKSLGGYRFDRGPSVFTEPHLVDELLSLSAISDIDFTYSKLPVSCCYFFDDGSRIVLPTGTSAVAKTLSDELGEDFKHVERRLKRLELNYKAVYAVFIQASLHRVRQWLNRNLLNAIYRIPFY